MQAQTIIALVSSVLTAIIAVTVPGLAFRFALRQEHARWLREQRTQLYTDLLTEAHAEQQYLDYDMADEEGRERMRTYWVDLRLPPLERARLAARATIVASRDVNKLFNKLQAAALSASFKAKPHEGDRTVARVRVAGILDELQAQVRQELGADDIRNRDLKR